MKVLLIWECIPDKTTLYSLEGKWADVAIAAAGYYVNSEENTDLLALSDYLVNLPQLGHSESHEAFDISGHDKVVICGFII